MTEEQKEGGKYREHNTEERDCCLGQLSMFSQLNTKGVGVKRSTSPTGATALPMKKGGFLW